MNTSTETRRGISLRLKLIGPFVAGALIIAGAVVYITYNSQLRSVEEQARKQAESIIAQTLATRQVYTRDVVGKLSADSIAAFPSQDFADVSGGIPLPATLVHRISDVVNEQGLYQINLISPWAINPAKSPASGWETDAINQLVNDPETDQFILDETSGSRLLYMSTDYASAETCVSCHNAHPESPKQDFKLGDMMGALVVEVPLTAQFAQARAQALATSGGFLAVLASFVVIVLWLQERSVLRPVEQLVQASRKMAQGELSTTVEVKSADEIGALATSFNQMTSQLRGTLGGLEQRVAERTKALETSAEVSRRLASILDPRQLASEVVNQVRTAFDYYHAQIFLFDEAGENLVLTAGTGEAGATMMKRGHSIAKGRGLVGRAANTKESILVSDTSQDPNWLPNELLPDTKAEAVVPIVIGDQVLGVLDVQDAITNDINSGDITLLESLAGQVAISLQNAGLYARADAALQEAQSLVDNAPEAIIIVDLNTGLFANPNENAVKLYGLPREELIKVGPAQMSPPNQPDGRDSTEKAMEKIGEAMQGGTPIFEWMHRNGQGQDFLCEIRLVRLPGAHPRVRASVADISERKRNEDLTRQRAQQQEALNLITQKIQSATTIESALQVTARELGRALGMKPTLVTLEPDSTDSERKSDS